MTAFGLAFSVVKILPFIFFCSRLFGLSLAGKKAWHVLYDSRPDFVHFLSLTETNTVGLWRGRYWMAFLHFFIIAPRRGRLGDDHSEARLPSFKTREFEV